MPWVTFRGTVSKTTKQRLLEQAVERLGLEETAGRLNTPIPLLQAWISGHAHMPDPKLLELADLLDQLSGPGV